DVFVFVDLLTDFVVGPCAFVLLAFDTVVFVVFGVVGLLAVVVWAVVDLFAAGLPATVVGFGAAECPSSAYADVSVKHAAAVKTRMLRASLIRSTSRPLRPQLWCRI